MSGIHFTNTHLDRACASWYSSSMKLFKNKKLVLIVFIVLFSMVAALFILEKKGVISLVGGKKNTTSNDAKTTSKAATAQEDFDDGDYRSPGNSIHENTGSGGISDNEGSIGNIDTSKPLISKTGEITVYAPQKDTVIRSGSTIAGMSSLAKVSYRLMDSVSGVISTGELSVVNGKFSGTLSFTTSAKEGRLDIYGTRANGTEFSNVEVPFRFE